MSIQYRYSTGFKPLELESPPLNTRPGLPPNCLQYLNLGQQTVNNFFLKMAQPRPLLRSLAIKYYIFDKQINVENVRLTSSIAIRTNDLLIMRLLP